MRFSTAVVLHPHAGSSHWCLALRIASMRKHVMIAPAVQLLLARPDNPGQSALQCQALQLEDPVSDLTNLRLGMAVTLTHVIRPGSPLWQLSLDELLLGEVELLVFFEGVDAMTSNHVQVSGLARLCLLATGHRNAVQDLQREKECIACSIVLPAGTLLLLCR
jgi:Inward rectifier potassium channel C-terminal domain